MATQNKSTHSTTPLINISNISNEAHKREDDRPLRPPALFSPTSSHLAHTLHSSTSLSTFEHLTTLFSLTPTTHPCPCSRCLTSSHHHTSIPTLSTRRYVTFIAPMVRYSKLPFRLLWRAYGANVAYTHMIIATGFNRSQQARDAECQTNALDQPLIDPTGRFTIKGISSYGPLAWLRSQLSSVYSHRIFDVFKHEGEGIIVRSSWSAREADEAAVMKWMTSIPDRLLFITGAKGAGKQALVKQCTKDRKNVLEINFATFMDRNDEEFVKVQQHNTTQHTQHYMHFCMSSADLTGVSL